MLRFCEPSAGQILVNGQAIQTYNSNALRKQIAAASQPTHLFNTSIRENLLLAKPEATQAELDAALLILDEPTEGLDSEKAVQVLNNILAFAQQHQQSIVLITHQLNDCRLVQQTLSLGADNP